MNIPALISNVSKIVLALPALATLILTLLPIGAITAFASSTGVILSDSSLSTLANEQVNFVVSTIYDESTTPGTYIYVSDNSAGGNIYNGTITGGCNSVSPDSDSHFDINKNKGVCYSHPDAGVYPVTIQLRDAIDGGAIGDPEVVTVTVTKPAPVELSGVITTEEFVTVDGLYKGIGVGFRTENFGTVTTVSVVLERADGTTVTKIANQGVLDIINLDTVGGDQLATPFVIEEGIFTEAGDITYWNPAPASWTLTTRPVKVTITVTDENGYVTVENSIFNDGDPSWPTYDNLIPSTPSTSDTIDPVVEITNVIVSNDKKLSFDLTATDENSGLEIVEANVYNEANTGSALVAIGFGSPTRLNVPHSGLPEGTLVFSTSTSDIDVSGLADGTYTIRAFARDHAGNEHRFLLLQFEVTTEVVDEKIEVKEETSGGGGGGGGGVKFGKYSAPTGEVLGASDSAGTCGMYLLEYMSIDHAPNSWEVMKLQLFLFSKGLLMGVIGQFDQATEASVSAYKTANSEAILKPWITAGLADANFKATGIVGKTTRWHINNAVCPGSEVFPQLP